MNKLRVRPDVRQEVEVALGKPIPEPSETAFVPFLKELSAQHPELARKLREGLEVEGLAPSTPPAALKDQVRLGQVRERNKNLLRSLFQRQQWQGKWVPDKRKVLLLGLLGAGLAAGVFILTLSRPTQKAVTPSTVGMVGDTLNRQSPPVVPAPVPAEPPKPVGNPPSVPINPVPGPPQTIVPRSTGLTPAPPAPSLTPAPVPSPGYGLVTPSGASPAIPQPERPQPLVYERKAPDSAPQAQGNPAAPPSSTPITLYNRPAATPESQAPTAAQASPPSQTRQDPTPKSFLVYERKGEEGSSVVYQAQARAQAKTQESPQSATPVPVERAAPGIFAQAAKPQPLLAYQRPAEEKQNSTDSSPQPTAPAASAGLKTLYQRSGVPSSPPSSPPQLGNPASQTSALPNPASGFAPGQRVTARLATAVLAVEKGSVPVLAESEGALWIGVATLADSKRIEITFNQVVQHGQAVPIQALAFDIQGVPGLEATIEEQAPSLASDMLRAAMSGVSTYVQGLAQAGTSTVLPGGGAVQNKEAPPLGITLLGEVGKLFALPQGQATVVRLARVAKDTPIQIVVGVGGKPGGQP